MDHDLILPKNLADFAGGTEKLFKELEDFKPGSERWYEMLLVRIRDYAQEPATDWLVNKLDAHLEMFTQFNGAEPPANAFQLDEWEDELWENQVEFWGKHLADVFQEPHSAGDGKKNDERDTPQDVAMWLQQKFSAQDVMMQEGIQKIISNPIFRNQVCALAATDIIKDIVTRRMTPAKNLSLMGIVAPQASGWPQPAKESIEQTAALLRQPDLKDKMNAAALKKLKKLEKHHPAPGTIQLWPEFLQRMAKLTGGWNVAGWANIELAAIATPMGTQIHEYRKAIKDNQSLGLAPDRVDGVIAVLQQRINDIQGVIDEIEMYANMAKVAMA